MNSVKVKNGLWYAQKFSGVYPLVAPFEKNQMSKKEGFVWVEINGKNYKLHVNERDVISQEVVPAENLTKVISKRFEVYKKFAHAVVDGKIKSMIVSGAPGIGKSYVLDQIFTQANNEEKIRLRVLRGNASAIGLYMAMYNASSPGSVLVLDDIDGALDDEDSLNLLKAALDTTGKREVSWLKMSNYLRENGMEQQFVFEGSIVFVTNTDFDRVIQKENKMSPHLKAFVDRSIYLDLCIHTPEQIISRIVTLVESGEFSESLGLEPVELMKIVDWMRDNIGALRSVSLRTVLHIANYMQISPDNWKDLASETMLKNR